MTFKSAQLVKQVHISSSSSFFFPRLKLFFKFKKKTVKKKKNASPRAQTVTQLS